jgi:hypothetical protein
MNDATRTTMQAAPRHSASPRIEAIAAWLIAALILAGGGIVARLIVDYPQFLPNSLYRLPDLPGRSRRHLAMGLRRDHHRQCSAEASRSPDRSGWLDRRVLRALRALISNPMPCVDNSGINPGTPPSIIQSGSQRFHGAGPPRLS